MCRNIKTLANFEPPATDRRSARIRAAVRPQAEWHDAPSRANEAVFERAVDEVTAAARSLLASLETNAAPRDRDEEARKAKERSQKRFA